MQRPEKRPRALRAGIWYFVPGFFEYSLGPWQPTLPAKPDLVALWKRTIDWYADHGLDFLVLHLGPYGGKSVPIGADRIRFGWGYHYVLEFDAFPEARCFDEDFRARNREIVRAVTEYGAEQGVDVFLHHYNFFAPVSFVDAHPELTRLEVLREGKWYDLAGKLKCQDMRKLLYEDLCWNKPLYREFLLATLQEFHERFPAAAGILATPGERARCPCIHCIGPQPSEAAAKSARFQDSPQKRRTLSHFVRTFAATLRGMGMEPLVRTWIAGVNREWIDVLPKGVTYVTKYSLFDLTDGGPDPEILPWIRAGHDMWVMKEHTGNENAGPMMLHPPDGFARMARECRELGVQGVMGVYNSEWGLQFKRSAVQATSEVLFAAAFGSPARDPEEAAREHYASIFGDVGPELLSAFRGCMEVPYGLPRLFGSRHEGFTCEFAYHFADFGGKPGGWPGTIGLGEEPNEWLARQIVPLGRYVEWLKKNPWSKGWRTRVTGEGADPLEFLQAATLAARRGAERIEELAARVPEEAAGELAMLQNSAQLAHLLGLQWSHWMRARLAYQGALGGGPRRDRQRLASLALADYRAGLEAFERWQPLLEELAAAGAIDRELSLETYYLGRNLPNARKGLERLEEDLAQLLR